jgi:hypothetical protein
MKPHNGWLFPLMVVAAGSVTAFGCIGIAAITGYLPLVRGGAGPLGDYPTEYRSGTNIERMVQPPQAAVLPAQPAGADSKVQLATRRPTAIIVVDGRNATTKAGYLAPSKRVEGPKKPAAERTVN